MPSPSEEKFNEYFFLINEMKKKKSLRTIYNQITKHGVEIFIDGDYRVLLEAHYLFENLYLSLWYEPEDFSQSRRISKFVI